MISLREILMDESRLYLVFEFVPMDLKKFIDSRPKKHLDEATTKSFTYQVDIFNSLIVIFLFLVTSFKCVYKYFVYSY